MYKWLLHRLAVVIIHQMALKGEINLTESIQSEVKRKSPILESHPPVEIYHLKFNTGLYRVGWALNRKGNLLFLFGYYSRIPDWHSFIYTVEGYFVTKFAIKTWTHGDLPVNSGYFTDDQIIVPLTRYKLLHFTDYRITRKPFPKTKCFAYYKNGEIYTVCGSLIVVYSLNTGSLRNFRKFPMLRNSTFESLAIKGDQMAVLTKCAYFYGQGEDSNFTIDRLCLITENVLQTLTFPNNSSEVYFPNQYCFDSFGTLIIHFSSQRTHSHCLWLPDGNSRLYQLEKDRTNRFVKLIGLFVTDNNALIHIYDW